jgi:hypothetical protein
VAIEPEASTGLALVVTRARLRVAGGHPSGPFRELASPEQDRAILSMLEMRDDIGLPDPRPTVPVMADVASRHPRLNLLNLEVVAVAQVLAATIWLSEQGAEGVLPGVLDGGGIAWTTITIG